MSKRVVFFKTVRSDGTSVWAVPPLTRTYKIGQRYEFPRYLPAHVFVAGGFKEAYKYRLMHSSGSRVLICYGLLRQQFIPFIDFTCKNPEFKLDFTTRWTSHSFTVIGEIFPPSQSTERARHNFSYGRKELARLRRFGRWLYSASKAGNLTMEELLKYRKTVDKQ